MNKWIVKIENLLKDNEIAFETSNYTDVSYINILNSSTMTRIKVYEYECGTIGKCIAILVQEFDCFGNETYNKEFATLGKRFVDRVKRNIG